MCIDMGATYFRDNFHLPIEAFRLRGLCADWIFFWPKQLGCLLVFLHDIDVEGPKISSGKELEYHESWSSFGAKWTVWFCSYCTIISNESMRDVIYSILTIRTFCMSSISKTPMHLPTLDYPFPSRLVNDIPHILYLLQLAIALRNLNQPMLSISKRLWGVHVYRTILRHIDPQMRRNHNGNTSIPYFFFANSNLGILLKVLRVYENKNGISISSNIDIHSVVIEKKSASNTLRSDQRHWLSSSSLRK